MKEGKFAKFIGKTFHRTVYRAVCILIALTALTAWSVSGIYAKYVDSSAMDGNAGVARMGVVTFDLLEHEAKDIGDDLDKIIGEPNNFSSIYELDLTSEVKANTYNKVMPGIDIPKDPFINLDLQSNEVSYELYLKVTEVNFPTYTVDVVDEEGGETTQETKQAIIYELASENWVKWNAETGKEDDRESNAGLYKFIGKREGVVNGVFVAGTKYKFIYSVTEGDEESILVEDESIHILKDDQLKVSQYFNSEKEIEFSLTFTAYLQQVINIPSGDTEGGN